jgi:DNA-binding response OmpR family regulator
MAVQDREAVLLAVQQIFKLTAAEVTILMLLIQNAEVHRDRIDLPRKTLDVHICRIRQRLQAFNIKVTTLWGYGYQLPAPHRRKAMALIKQSGRTQSLKNRL